MSAAAVLPASRVCGGSRAVDEYGLGLSSEPCGLSPARGWRVTSACTIVPED